MFEGVDQVRGADGVTVVHAHVELPVQTERKAPLRPIHHDGGETQVQEGDIHEIPFQVVQDGIRILKSCTSQTDFAGRVSQGPFGFRQRVGILVDTHQPAIRANGLGHT